MVNGSGVEDLAKEYNLSKDAMKLFTILVDYRFKKAIENYLSGKELDEGLEEIPLDYLCVRFESK